MKIIFQKIAFLIVGTYLVVTLVASNQIARSNPNNDIKNVENCLVDRLLGKECIVPKQPKVSPTQTPSPTPNVNLTDKERFIAALMNHFPKIPLAGTYEYILLRAYGATFVNLKPTIKLPAKVAFSNHQETQKFQATLTKGKVAGTRNCYLLHGVTSTPKPDSDKDFEVQL
ncbi:MAG: hypothetical protein MJK14_22525 [Rivularia sp. ALOHA_DT_140]|nr:hypothetical protein [Rivularia sp. ALOHA_DT_140]